MLQHHFKNYHDCHAVAQKIANERKCDIGIEKASPYDPGFLWFTLPNPKNRFGHELRCEVVHPEKWEDWPENR